MTHPDEGNEEGITYDCTLCGDSGWLVKPSQIPHRQTSSSACICAAGRRLADEIGHMRELDHAQPARLQGI